MKFSVELYVFLLIPKQIKRKIKTGRYEMNKTSRQQLTYV